MANKKKPAHENKSKEQIAYEMHQRQEALRKRKFVGEVFFPLLLAQDKSIQHTKNFCKILENDIMATFNEGMKQPLSTLGLEKKFEGQEDEAVVTYRGVLEAFKELPIGEALELISGLPGAIDAALAVKDRERPLSDFAWGDGNLEIKNG